VTCRDTVHLIEAIAAGDLVVADDVRAHFETCPTCAAALASARRVDALLRARGAAEPPPEFASAVLARIRADRWQSEQRVDRIFNVAIVIALALIVGSLAAITNVSGVLAGSTWVWRAVADASTRMLESAVPALATYVAAVGVLMSALLMWWWAERSYLSN
jgi:anti-sigma factor RsiW